MARKNTDQGSSTADTSASARRGPKGKVAPVSIVVLAKTASLIVVFVVYYLLAFFAALQVVPMIMSFVKAGTGVTLDMPVETVVSVWLVPALFLVSLLFVLVIVIMRALWRLRASAMSAVSRWALGTDTTVVHIAPSAPGRLKPVTKNA